MIETKENNEWIKNSTSILNNNGPTLDFCHNNEHFGDLDLLSLSGLAPYSHLY